MPIFQKSLDGKINCCIGSSPFPPFHHPVTHSCRTILCTKRHLSYYKFSAEYSADPKGLRTKREYRWGHLWNAKGELPQSFHWRLFHGRRSSEWDTDSCDRSPQRWLPECFCVQPAQRDLSRCRKWFVSLNGINSLVTFRQPWHNCAINVTDSFAGSSWLVLNHHYVAVCSADTLSHCLFLLLLVLLVKMYNMYLNKMYSCIL